MLVEATFTPPTTTTIIMTTTTANIILFGEPGCGKSSIINMLSSSNVASVSNGISKCTLEGEGYQVKIDGKDMTIWDTAGIDEGEDGRVSIANLYNLLLNVRPGCNLLVFVTHPRLRESAQRVWKLFHEVVCCKVVPIVIVVTGLEEEKDRDGWWRDNKAKLHSYGMHPDGHACITASRGKALNEGHVYDKEFEESKAIIQGLLRSKYRKELWYIGRADWFETRADTTYETRFFGMCSPRTVRTYKQVEGPALWRLVKVCGMSKEEAGNLAKKMEEVHSAPLTVKSS